VRVARESLGATGQVVAQQWLANTTAPNVPVGDRRRLDMVVYGASARGEALCCDATVVSPLRRNGLPIPRAHEVDGAALTRARRRKERTYPEVGHNGTRLVVLACEVGGRWSVESLDFVRRLARHRAAQAPPVLRQAVAQAFARRWWTLLGVAVQDALAATIMGLPTGPLPAGTAAAAPPFAADVLTAYADAGTPSRLPLRG